MQVHTKGKQSFAIYSNVNICHGRKSNLVEFQILPEESPTGICTSWTFYQAKLGVSTSRKSNLGDLGIALGSKI